MHSPALLALIIQAAHGVDSLAALLTALAPLLLMGGIVGAYLEIKMPGLALPGIVATVCFTLFFTGSYLAGLAGWEVMILFALGVALLLSEIFLHPGTILPGVAGLLLILGTLLWAMIDRDGSEPFWPTGAMLLGPLLKLLGAAALAAVAIALLARVLPQTSFHRRLVLAERTPPGEMIPNGPSEPELVPGLLGTARTMLRPSGKAEIGGELIDVVSQGDFIPSGALLRIIAVEGTRVVVVKEPDNAEFQPP